MNKAYDEVDAMSKDNKVTMRMGLYMSGKSTASVRQVR